MNITKLADIKSLNNDFNLKKLFTTNEFDLMKLVIKPSEVLDRQVHPFKSIFYVAQGKGIIEVGNNRKVVDKDSVIEIEANQEIGWINAKEEDLELIMLKLKA